MENMEFRIGSSRKNDMVKLYLNSADDFVYIDPNDSGLFDRFAGFISWLDDKGAELEQKEKEIGERYGDAVIRDSEGEVADFNTAAVLELCRLRTDSYREACRMLDGIFGADTCRKYFRDSYEINPDFVPDDMGILEFMEQITPVFNDIFRGRKEKLDLKYSKSRKGGGKTRYRDGNGPVAGTTGQPSV